MLYNKFGYTEERLIKWLKKIQEPHEKLTHKKFGRIEIAIIVIRSKLVSTKLFDESTVLKANKKINCKIKYLGKNILNNTISKEGNGSHTSSNEEEIEKKVLSLL